LAQLCLQLKCAQAAVSCEVACPRELVLGFLDLSRGNVQEAHLDQNMTFDLRSFGLPGSTQRLLEGGERLDAVAEEPLDATEAVQRRSSTGCVVCLPTDPDGIAIRRLSLIVIAEALVQTP